jgi:hypothetical protein
MTYEELLHIMHHIFLCLAGGYWYSMESEQNRFPTFLVAVHLNQFKNEAMLLISNIVFKFGGLIKFQLAT